MIPFSFHKLSFSESRIQWAWLTGSLLLELAVVFFFSGQRPLPPDYVTYSRFADSIVAGQGYLEAGKAFTFFPPGYPIYLIPFHVLADLFHMQRPLVIVAMNLPMGAVTTLLVRRIAKFYFQGRSVELVTLLWTTYPFQLILLTQPNSEVPFLFFFIASVVLFLHYLTNCRTIYLVGSGLLLGISCLIRPITLYLAIAGAVVLLFQFQSGPLKPFFQTNRRSASLIWILSFLLVLFPWEFYVYHYNHQWIPVQGKSSLLIYQGLLFGHEMYAGQRIPVPQEVYELMNRIAYGDPTIPAILNELQNAEVSVVAKLTGLKALRCWYGLWNNPYESLTKWIQFSYLIVSFLGCVSYYRHHRISLLSLFPVLLILFFWSTTFLLIPLVRYMIPAMPFVLLYIPALLPYKNIPIKSGELHS